MTRIFKTKFLLIVLFIALTAFSLKSAFQKAAGIVTAPITFVSGMTLGKVVEGATSSTMDKYSSLIANYESANTNSINRLDTALQHRITQFDVTLQNRLVQLDEVLKTSAKQIDLGVKDNIEKIDDVLKERIGGLNTGLTRTSFILTSGLWRIFKGSIQLLIFLILVYFIFKIVLEVNRHGGISAAEKKEILKRASPLFIISLVAFIFVSFFNPITNKYTNPDYSKLIESYNGELETYSKSYDYKKASYVSYLLAELDFGNYYYKYLQAKYNLLKNLSYRTKYAIFNPQSRSELKTIYNDFIDFYEKSNTKDPEFSTINALINQNFFNNTEGDVLAALASYSSLFIERNNVTPSNLLGTDVYAANIYKNFFFHMPKKEEIEKVIKQYGISITPDELESFLTKQNNVDSLLYSSSLHAPYFLYNSLTIDLTKSDESNFIKYLNYETINDTSKMRLIGNSMIEKWISFTNEISNEAYDIDKIRFNSISLNDGLVQYVINSLEKNTIPLSDTFSKFSNDATESFKKALTQANQNDTTKITIFKKAIGKKLISYFQEKPQQFIISLLGTKTSDIEIINDFANSYKKMKGINAQNIDEFSFDVFEKCIINASKIGIYSYEKNPNQPLADYLLSNMIVTMKPFEEANANKYNYEALRKAINENLMSSIYNKINLL